MNRSLVIAMVLSCSVTNGQQEAKPFVESASKSYVQPPTVGIYFTFNDFETADAIRNSSLAAVIRDKKYGKLQNMSQGLAVSYGKGLSANYDFVGTLEGAFLSYPVPNTDASANEGLLLEGDASIRGKMFSDKSWFVPYLQAGVVGYICTSWPWNTDQFFWRSIPAHQHSIPAGYL
jgi:hypothetical protein